MLRNVFSRQVAMAEATKIVSDWLEQPAVACLDPTERHWRLLQEQLLEGQVSAPGDGRAPGGARGGARCDLVHHGPGLLAIPSREERGPVAPAAR